MKRGKRAAVVALAIGLAVTGSMVSSAANDKDLVEGNYGGITDGEAKSILTGTTRIIGIQVKVPIAVSFDIGPNITVAAGAAIITSSNQIIAQASNYTITNTSKVSLVASITGVKAKTGAMGDTPALVNTLNDLTGENVVFAIGKGGDSIKYPSAAADNTRKWMTTAIVTTDFPYQVAPTVGDNTLAPEDTLNMTLYGATGAGWKNGDSFQVTLTFTIVLQSSQDSKIKP